MSVFIVSGTLDGACLISCPALLLGSRGSGLIAFRGEGGMRVVLWAGRFFL